MSDSQKWTHRRELAPGVYVENGTQPAVINGISINNQAVFRGVLQEPAIARTAPVYTIPSTELEDVLLAIRMEGGGFFTEKKVRAIEASPL